MGVICLVVLPLIMKKTKLTENVLIVGRPRLMGWLLGPVAIHKCYVKLVVMLRVINLVNNIFEV
jgi:hypothetical protein